MKWRREGAACRPSSTLRCVLQLCLGGTSDMDAEEGQR